MNHLEHATSTAASRAHAANRAAWAAYQSADYLTTLQHATAALGAAREAGERSLEAEALSHLGHVYAGLGDYTSALNLQQQSIAILRDLHRLEGLPRPMAGLANLYGALGDHEAQRLVFEEALAIAREIGDAQGVASAMVGLGVAHLDGGNLSSALHWLQAGTQQCASSGLSIVEVVGYDQQALLRLQQGALDDALALHHTALALAQRTGNRKAEARQYQRVGSVLIRQGRLHEAVVQLQRAEHLARDLGLPRLTEEIHAAQSEAYEHLGDTVTALAHLRAQMTLERARLNEEARQRVGVLSAQTRAAWTQREADQQRRQVEAMTHLAHHDPLTGLANRAGLAAALLDLTSDPEPFALLFLDLDGFKAINDTLGHEAGDALLSQVARALEDALAEERVIARIGGDEFTVTVMGVRDHEAAADIARQLAQALDRPFQVGGQDVFITASIGISRYPHDAQTAESLLRHADLAMYQVKREGKNGWQHFQPAMTEQARTRLQVESGLRGALAREELQLYYQPQIDVKDGRLVGLEALLRWFPDGGPPVSPESFIPAAEASGLMVQIGAWTLETACAQLAAWQRAGHPELRLAVNISPVQLVQPDFVELVRQTLIRHAIKPGTLELELTERGVVNDLDTAEQQFRALRARGIRIALDDFGAGESNLARLLQLPFDVLKLDRGLIRALGQSPGAARALQALGAFAGALHLEVVAEGVETAEQLAAVRDLGCHRAQGYLTGRPVPGRAVVLDMSSPG